MGATSNHFYIDIKLKNKKNVGSENNSITINSDNIVYLNIKENILSILPRMEMVINDVGSLIENASLYDKDVMSIVIAPERNLDESVSLDFNVSIFSSDTDPSEQKYSVLKIVGYLAVTDMFVPYQNRAFDINSADLLSRIADEVEVEFTNPQSVIPNDKMIWYQNSNNYNFIKHILKRSYVDNDAVFFYGNTKNQFVYTSLEAEAGKEHDFIARYNKKRVDNFLLGDEETDIMYYDSSDILNLTELYNNMSNYGASFGLYDLNGDRSGGLVTSDRRFTDLLNRSKRYDGEAACFKNIGLISNPNMYRQFPKAVIQNFYYRYNLFSVSISLNINASTDVKLFDKVNLAINSTYNRDDLNDVYSGTYLVTGITHNVANSNQYQKQVVLCRNGLNKTDSITEYGVN